MQGVPLPGPMGKERLILLIVCYSTVICRLLVAVETIDTRDYSTTTIATTSTSSTTVSTINTTTAAAATTTPATTVLLLYMYITYVRYEYLASPIPS